MGKSGLQVVLKHRVGVVSELLEETKLSLIVEASYLFSESIGVYDLPLCYIESVKLQHS